MSLLKKIMLATLALMYGASLFSLAIPFATRDGLFVSPDEHATWTFAERIAKTGVAGVEEVRNISLDGFLHPRSTVTVHDTIVPAGFLGITYIAGAFFFISPFLAAFVGPLLCVLGLFALYNIVRFFGASQEFALWTAIALAIHPAWWYYSIRSLMPNVPFVALLLCAGWTATIAIRSKQTLSRCFLWIFTGSLFGLALAIRPSEWVWIFGCFLAGMCLFFQVYKNILGKTLSNKKKEIASFLFGLGLIGGLGLALQSVVYGSPLTTGYTVDQSVWQVGHVITEGISASWHEKVFGVFFPFGFYERATLWNVWRYIFVLYPWMTVVGIFGMAVFAWDKKQEIQKKELSRYIPLGLCGLSLAYILVLYGSWVFFDNPDPAVVSLGNSHTRYWLPLFVVLAPAVAYFLQRGRDIFTGWALSEKTRQFTRVFPSVILVLMGVCSANLVFGGDDGVLHTRTALATFEEKRTAILAATPEDAIVIVDRGDKYLWPYRAVAVPFRSKEMYAKIPELLNISPLYYFSITLPEEDLAYLHDVIFAGTNIILTPMITLTEETLYEIHRK